MDSVRPLPPTNPVSIPSVSMMRVCKDIIDATETTHTFSTRSQILPNQRAHCRPVTWRVDFEASQLTGRIHNVTDVDGIAVRDLSDRRLRCAAEIGLQGKVE